MMLFQSCMESGQILCGTFEENAILTGVSDIIIVKQKSGKYKCTPFLVCFGPYLLTHQNKRVNTIINKNIIKEVSFTLDHKGYIHPQQLSDK